MLSICHMENYGLVDLHFCDCAFICDELATGKKFKLYSKINYVYFLF